MTRAGLLGRNTTQMLAAGLFFAMAGCSASKQPEHTEQASPPAQAQDAAVDRNFDEAISNLSTNTSFVLVTITDRKSGTTKTGCASANGLLGAIHRERNIGYDEASVRSVQAIAMAAPHHRFVFAKSDALANVGFTKLETQYPEECGLLRGGWTASRGDIGYGLFTNKPGYRPAAGQSTN